MKYEQIKKIINEDFGSEKVRHEKYWEEINGILIR